MEEGWDAGDQEPGASLVVPEEGVSLLEGAVSYPEAVAGAGASCFVAEGVVSFWAVPWGFPEQSRPASLRVAEVAGGLFHCWTTSAAEEAGRTEWGRS